MSLERALRFVNAVKGDPDGKYKAGVTVVKRLLGTNALGTADIVNNRKLIQLGADWPDLVWIAYKGVPGAPDVLKWSTGQADQFFDDLLAAGTTVSDIVAATPAQFGQEAANRVVLVLGDAKLSPHPTSGGYMRQLIGSRWLTGEDILTALAQGTVIVDDVAEGVLANPAVDKAALLDQLYAVRGISEFFGTVVTRSGKQWGGELEVRSLIILIREGTEPEFLRLSMPMVDGRLGPDIIVYIVRTQGDELFEVLECKALEDFGQIVAERAHSAVVHKLGSSIARMGQQGWKTVAKGEELTAAARAAWEGSSVPKALWNGEFTFLFNFKHFLERAEDPVGYLRNFIRRHENDPNFDFDTDIWTDNQTLADEMANAMAGMADQMTNLYRGIKDGAGIDAAGQRIILNMMNATRETAAEAAGRAVPTPLTLADLNPQTLFENGLISADELTQFVDLPVAELWRHLALRGVGLTEDMVETMPTITIRMKLVFEGVAGVNDGFFLEGLF